MRLSGQSFRPSSREGKDKESDIKCHILNLSQDELSFASQMKIEIMQL